MQNFLPQITKFSTHDCGVELFLLLNSWTSGLFSDYAYIHDSPPKEKSQNKYLYKYFVNTLIFKFVAAYNSNRHVL